MRTKRAFYNVLSGLFLQILLILSGFIVTRFFIEYYGTEVNGLVGATNQIIATLSIIEAGVGAAAITLLYEPLQKDDYYKISSVLKSTQKFYRRSGYVYSTIIAIIIIFYPMFLGTTEHIENSRILLVVLSIGTLIDYFFFGKYRVLLTADQKIYIITISQSIVVILSTVLSLYLIINQYHYVFVKLIAGMIIFVRFFIVKYYIEKRYSYLKNYSEISEVVLTQRWGAFIHQVASVIVFNTDMIVLSIFGGTNRMTLVGVYVVYNYIYASLVDLVNSITTNFVPSFGSLLSEKETEKIKSIFTQFEFIVYFIVYVAYTCFSILLLPFIKVYTSGITDANYLDINLVILFTIMAVLNAIRIPGNIMIHASGHFKQTQFRALAEAIINIVLSVIFVHYIGIYGVLIGTIVSFLYRSSDTILYNRKYIVKNTLPTTIKRLVINTIVLITLMGLSTIFHIRITTYLDWFIYAMCVGIVVVFVYVIVNIIFDRNDLYKFLNKLKMLRHSS